MNTEAEAAALRRIEAKVLQRSPLIAAQRVKIKRALRRAGVEFINDLPTHELLALARQLGA